MSLFTMPSLGADMETGTLVEWLVRPGDRVSRGDIVAVVETQKGAIEIEIFEDGVVQRLRAELGQTLPVGAPLAEIGDAAQAPGAPPSAEGQAQAPEAPRPGEAVEAAQTRAPAPEGPAPVAAELARAAPSSARGPEAPHAATDAGAAAAPRRASPAARSLAAERGVDLASVPGTGPGGAVVLADVERAARGAPAPAPAPAAAPPAAPGARPGLDLAAMREAIAAAMARSKREIPHYYLAHEVDLQRAADWVRDRNAARSPQDRLLMGALFVRATALAAAEMPGLSGHYENGCFAPGPRVNVGVAVALRGGGLVAPAIRDTVARSLDEVMAAMRDLVSRARAGRLRSSEMTDGTITVSALGEKGVDAMTGVIYPPQVALVGFGTPRLAPRVVDGAVVARTGVTVTLAADHRVSDGRRGAQFLPKIDSFLRDPESL